MSVGKKSILLILAVVIVDQISKIWIKTNFELGDSVRVTSWFYIHFVENPGMAFGMKFIPKLYLTLFRIVAVIGIGYLIYRFIKQNKYPTGFIICLSLIFAGALGNIIDSVFYGVIFDTGTVFNPDLQTYIGYQGVSTLSTQGYAPLFHGNVVDMLDFPLFTFPEWVPFFGGGVFFSPIFNLADSAITIGVACLLIFYRKLLDDKKR